MKKIIPAVKKDAVIMKKYYDKEDILRRHSTVVLPSGVCVYCIAVGDGRHISQENNVTYIEVSICEIEIDKDDGEEIVISSEVLGVVKSGDIL